MSKTKKELEEELLQMTEMAKRALADLQNFKKRADEERSNLVGLGKISVITTLLPVLDNFNRALVHLPTEIQDNEWVKGVSHIQKQLEQIAVTNGLEPIPAVGLKADPHLHEIVSTTEGEQDIVIVELEKGYTFEGKVIRVSKVVVGQG